MDLFYSFPALSISSSYETALTSSSEKFVRIQKSVQPRLGTHYVRDSLRGPPSQKGGQFAEVNQQEGTAGHQTFIYLNLIKTKTLSLVKSHGSNINMALYIIDTNNICPILT